METRQLLSAVVSDPIITPSVVIVPAAAASSVQGFTPTQLKTAYGIKGDGSGQTIAIVDAYSDPNIALDLAVFDKQFGLLAPPSFKQVSATGSTTNLPAANAGWDTEIALDVEWAHAIAQKANIVLVDAASDSLTSLMAAVNYARNLAGVSVISMSWGTSEFFGQTSYDTSFTTPAGHTGITFIAASGDEGASGGAEWPAVSSNVLSVGGTSLTLSSTGTIAAESAWSDSSGGSSRFETLAVQSAATGLSTRTSPDVSYNADPNTGVAVYDSVPYQGYVGWQQMGGTSAGAPQWAGIIAIADTARVTAKATTLTTAQVLGNIYTLYANSTTYAADFSDVTTGSTVLGRQGGFRGRGTVVYSYATKGYDSLTGVGSPKGAGLIAALASYKSASSSTSTTTKAAVGITATVNKNVVFADAVTVGEFLALTTQTSSLQDEFLDVTSNWVEAGALATNNAGGLEESELTSSLVASAEQGFSFGTAGPLPMAIGETLVPIKPALPEAELGTLALAPMTTADFHQIANAIGLPFTAAATLDVAILPGAAPSLIVSETWQGLGRGLTAISSALTPARPANFAVAVVGVALVGYCYVNRGAGEENDSHSLFNDRKLIEQYNRQN